MGASEGKQNNRRKRWNLILILSGILMFVMVMGFCALLAIGIVEGMKPKTKPVYYQGASIDQMFENCEQERLYPWEDWMAPVAGSDLLISLNYSKSAPAPEAIYGYTLFIEINPALIVPGEQVAIPGPGVKPFLLETRAPYMVCSSDLTGSLKFLEFTGTSLSVDLSIHGSIYKTSWEYEGQLEMNQASLPQ